MLRRPSTIPTSYRTRFTAIFFTSAVNTPGIKVRIWVRVINIECEGEGESESEEVLGLVGSMERTYLSGKTASPPAIG